MGQLLAAEPHDRDDQRHRELGQQRQIRAQEPLEALVREPDRVDEPLRRLPQPRRRVPLPGLQGDGLRDERVEGKALGLQESIPEGAPGGDRIVGPGAVQHRAAQLDAAQVHAQCPAPGTSADSRSAASSTGPSTQRRT